MLVLFEFLVLILILKSNVNGFKFVKNQNYLTSKYSQMPNDNENILHENQMSYMSLEKLVLVDNDDVYIGKDSKKNAHTFDHSYPRGKLHRAFSVFLFNSQGKLLIQQRAKDKITFPGVWSNTCCSHPVIDILPNEVDDQFDIRSGKVDGIKNAAIRKLKHELGINTINKYDIKYLTRLHYWAADIQTHGKDSCWGENEIDYILFIVKDVDHTINQEEIKETRYISCGDLVKMMDLQSGYSWSPWFRIIADKFLPNWWSNLSQTMNTDKYTVYDTIYRFDPSPEYFGGAGKAGKWLGEADRLII